jgi:hypothetical protein
MVVTHSGQPPLDAWAPVLKAQIWPVKTQIGPAVLLPHVGQSSGVQRHAPEAEMADLYSPGPLAKPRRRRLIDLGPFRRIPRSAAVPPHAAAPPLLPPSFALPHQHLLRHAPTDSTELASLETEPARAAPMTPR